MSAVRSRLGLRVALLALALAQFFSPFAFYLLGGSGLSFGGSDAGEPQIVPAGYAFAWWGLVISLTLAYAIWQAVTRRAGEEIGRIAAPLSVTTSGFVVWLALAASPALAPLTVVVFVVMYCSLVVAASRAQAVAVNGWPSAARNLLWSMVGIYAGWSGIAIWVNLATSLARLGAPTTGTWSIVWQLLTVAAAAGLAVLIALRFRDNLVLALTFGAGTLWALVGAAFGATYRQAPPLSLGATVASVLFAATLAVLLAATRSARNATTAASREA